MERAARADERARQLEVGARVDEQPAVLVPEAEKPELVEAPADDALILGESSCGEGGCSAADTYCSNDQIPAEFVGRT